MRLYKAIIVDDERPVLQLMKHVIDRHGRYTIEGMYINSLEALESVSVILPDIAFLDIEMPKINGLELALKINERSPQTRIVFSTAYKNYALEAFDVNAIDYILKPVTLSALSRVTSRLDQLLPVEQAVSISERAASIRCFGGFEVRNPEGELVRWPTRKTEELYAYLLCHPDREISKWRLADALWPEMDEDRAMNNMYNTIYRLKKVLKEQRIEMDVHKTYDGYSLDTGGVVYDMIAYQRSAISDTEGFSEDDLYAVYQGKLLDSKDYYWKTGLEAAYGRQYAAVVRRLALRHLTLGEWERAETRLLAYLEHEPLDEEMNGLLVEIYEKSGQVDKARKRYASFAAAYQSEFGEELTAPSLARRDEA